MCAVNCAGVFVVPGTRWLPYNFDRSVLSGLSSLARARVVDCSQETFVNLPPVATVPLLQDLPT